MQEDDGKACKLLPQVKHLGMFVVIELHTNGNVFTVWAVLGQTKTQTTVAVALVAADCVYTDATAHIHLALIYICNNSKEENLCAPPGFTFRMHHQLVLRYAIGTHLLGPC